MTVLIAVINGRCSIIFSKGTDKVFLMLVSADDGDIFDLKRCIEKLDDHVVLSRCVPEVDVRGKGTNLVFAWILQNAGEYGFDIRYIFAVGDSAGANIFALYSAVCTNPDYAKCFRFRPPQGFVPKAVALNCGLYCAEAEKNQDNLIQELILDYLPMQCFEEELEQINVLRNITNVFPPVFLMTCSGDFLKEQAPLLVQCFSLMNEEQKKQVVETYFSKEGMNYRLVRIPIDRCDFCLDTYEAMSDPQDTGLKSFTFERTEKYILPMLADIKKVAGDALKIMLTHGPRLHL